MGKAVLVGVGLDASKALILQDKVTRVNGVVKSDSSYHALGTVVVQVPQPYTLNRAEETLY